MASHRTEVDIDVDCPGCGHEIRVEVPLLIGSGNFLYTAHECPACEQRFRIGGSMDYDILDVP